MHFWFLTLGANKTQSPAHQGRMFSLKLGGKPWAGYCHPGTPQRVIEVLGGQGVVQVVLGFLTSPPPLSFPLCDMFHDSYGRTRFYKRSLTIRNEQEVPSASAIPLWLIRMKDEGMNLGKVSYLTQKAASKKN